MSADDSTITYDYSQCDSIYNDLVNDQGTISATMALLVHTINSNMNSWVGMSADQWQKIQSGWNQELGTMQADLNAAASALPEMTANMKHADTAAAVRIASIGQ